MSSKLKFAVILGLVSTTALTSYASTNPYSSTQTYSASPNKMQTYKGHKELKSSHAKHTNATQAKVTKNQIFVPFVAKQVLVTFDNELEILANIGQEYVGQKITSEILQKINTSIADYYLAHDYLLPQVHVDKDAMLSELLVLDVKAASISNVNVMGDGNKNALLQQYADKIASQQPTMKHYTQKYLALMNKIPGMEVSYQLVTNEEQSTKNNTVIDLIIHTSQKKASLFASGDNFSPNSLGKYQFSLLGEVYTPFSNGDALTVNGATTNHPNRLSDIGVGYSYILNDKGTTAHFFGSHAEDNSTRNQSIVTPNTSSNSARVALTQQLVLRAGHDLELEVGTQYNTSTEYQVNTSNVSEKYKVSKYTAADIGLRYLLKDKFKGRSLIHSNFTYGLTGTYKNYQDVPANLADRHFKKSSFNYYRDQEIIGNFSAFAHLAMSQSGSNLPDSQLSTIGGRDFGRGYDFGALVGTKMRAASLELRYTKEMDQYYINQLQPYLYGDYGHMNRFYSDTNVSSLKSWGGGLRIRFMKKVDFGMEVAKPTKKNFTVNGTAIKAKTKFNVFINKMFEF